MPKLTPFQHQCRRIWKYLDTPPAIVTEPKGKDDKPATVAVIYNRKLAEHICNLHNHALCQEKGLSPCEGCGRLVQDETIRHDDEGTALCRSCYRGLELEARKQAQKKRGKP